jgi:hypothetical protein
MRNFIVVAAAALSLAACVPSGTDTADPETAESGCRDEGAPLAGTGLCQSVATAMLAMPPEGAQAETFPEGCEAVVNEVMLPGDEALLYRAARCNGTTTQLAFAGGAQSAEISIETLAFDPAAEPGQVVIRLFGTEPNPQGALTAAIAALPAAEQGQCEIRAAGIEGWPADALVIAPTAAARARMPQNEPIQACGPLGLDEDSTRYWRVAQGYAWFFDLGQESQGFDPASLTRVRRDADGAWTVVE